MNILLTSAVITSQRSAWLRKLNKWRWMEMEKNFERVVEEFYELFGILKWDWFIGWTSALNEDAVYRVWLSWWVSEEKKDDRSEVVCVRKIELALNWIISLILSPPRCGYCFRNVCKHVELKTVSFYSRIEVAKSGLIIAWKCHYQSNCALNAYK